MVAKNGKIDLIIPWVDGNDPAWRSVRDKCRAELTASNKNIGGGYKPRRK